MVGDLVLRFKAALQPPQSQLLPYLSRLVYTCIKVRGYKTAGTFLSWVLLKLETHKSCFHVRSSALFTVKLFPHDPSDLTFLLDLLNEPPESTDYSWMVQYISLLWLSLVVKLPFDLKRWDTDQGPSTLDRIMGIAFQHLNSPGVDREAASIVLGALCSRYTSHICCNRPTMTITNSFLQATGRSIHFASAHRKLRNNGR